jgi:hypothetical protein
MGSCVAYCRVTTQEQGRPVLGAVGQRQAVSDLFTSDAAGELLAKRTGLETG